MNVGFPNPARECGRITSSGAKRREMPQFSTMAIEDYRELLAIGRDKLPLGDYCFGISISTTSEFSRKRSNTICFPSGVMSKVRIAARF